ncbi:pyridine nucleotide transhydrogenase [Paenibacillus periandrae]|uniref:pyridine nucleotide transhydrogenase n=1 Tax=Paenibacillus periandrae TaxID=1761741 RepID=UPI001F09D711|nr:pyridine nucleotide transhydrogenase [Paenibacillus periandrae]
MKTALIGHTGFVGSILSKQTVFSDFYNSKNIADIRGKKFKRIVCAGAPAVKWKANQEPVADWENIQSLISHLDQVEAEEFILISTVDVYRIPNNVDENTEIIPEEIDPYGKHRYLLEEFVRNRYSNHFIVRLPGLFGEGLKKNVIYDLIHDNCLHLIHHQNVFQFYDLSRIWDDISIVTKNNLKLVNFSTEPVMVSEIASECFNINFDNVIEKAPVFYNMKSIYSKYFNSSSEYMITKEELFARIKQFIERETK